jgi:hypothetical protein
MVCVARLEADAERLDALGQTHPPGPGDRAQHVRPFRQRHVAVPAGQRDRLAEVEVEEDVEDQGEPETGPADPRTIR